MRPPTVDEALAMLQRDLPEFEERYRDLRELYGEDLTSEVVFMELADFVTGLLVSCGSAGTLDRCFALADETARMPGGRELVGYAFLNAIAPGARPLARPHMSSDLSALLDHLSAGGPADDEGGAFGLRS
jgi:hypothetical protein